MFAYQVMNEHEAMQERFHLLKEGEYDAIITSSSDSQSKSGNPMMDMTVTVFDEEGREHPIRDFLVFTNTMMWKVIHFAESAGISKEYESGVLCSEKAIDCRVRVKVTVEEGNEIPQDRLKGKALGSKYPDKNKIDDYVKRDDQKSDVKHNDDPFEDDDIPFI